MDGLVAFTQKVNHLLQLHIKLAGFDGQGVRPLLQPLEFFTARQGRRAFRDVSSGPVAFGDQARMFQLQVGARDCITDKNLLCAPARTERCAGDAEWARALARESAGSSRAARMPMMAMTTKSSTKVKAPGRRVTRSVPAETGVIVVFMRLDPLLSAIICPFPTKLVLVASENLDRTLRLKCHAFSLRSASRGD